MTFWRELLQTDSPVILDIGANDGETTADFLRQFPGARIAAFEPDPRAIRKFKARNSDPRVHLYETAIGASDGVAYFHVSSGIPPWATTNPKIEERHYPEGWDQSGSLRAPKNHGRFWPWVKFESKIIVPVMRLDTSAWVMRLDPESKIDLIWADVQGAEGDLIAGGHRTLQRTKFFWTEYSDSEWYEGQPTLRELAAMLPDFEIIRTFPKDVLFWNRCAADG